MDQKEIRKIVELMNEHELTYFHLEEEGVNLKIKKGAEIVQMAQPPAALPTAAAHAPPAQTTPETAAPSTPAANQITAPMVGTFYTASSPDAPAFVNVGDSVSEGQTICIIEAMKVMNEIKAEISGSISAIVAKDGEPVQYGDALFHIH